MVLCIDPREKEVYPVGEPLNTRLWSDSHIQKGEAKFVGAVASHGKIFFFPGNANRPVKHQGGPHSRCVYVDIGANHADTLDAFFEGKASRLEPTDPCSRLLTDGNHTRSA